MGNNLKRYLKIYLSFSRSDRNAILILCILILLAIIFNIIVRNIETKPSSDIDEFKELLELWKQDIKNEEIVSGKLFMFNPNTISESELDSLELPKQIKKNLINYRNAGGKFYSPIEVRKIYGMNDSIFENIEKYIKIHEPKKATTKTELTVENEITGFFDPNKASVSKLKNFGFSSFQINNLIRYREKGGNFLTKTDLLKIYGVDSIFYRKIENFIQIEKLEFTEPKEIVEPKINFVELNNADSTQLVKLVGIGPVFASRIIKYRKLLGGFYSKNQLLEVYNFNEETYEQIKNSILVDTFFINKIRINFADYSELIKHPYINKMQVETILTQIRNNGAITKKEQLLSSKTLDSLTYYKMRPYITCR